MISQFSRGAPPPLDARNQPAGFITRWIFAGTGAPAAIIAQSRVPSAVLPAAMGPYGGQAAWAPNYRPGNFISSIKVIPDLTGATPDITLWSFFLSFNNVTMFRCVNLANNFELKFRADNDQVLQLDHIIAYYAGANVSGLNANFVQMDLESAS